MPVGEEVSGSDPPTHHKREPAACVNRVRGCLARFRVAPPASTSHGDSGGAPQGLVAFGHIH